MKAFALSVVLCSLSVQSQNIEAKSGPVVGSSAASTRQEDSLLWCFAPASRSAYDLIHVDTDSAVETGHLTLLRVDSSVSPPRNLSQSTLRQLSWSPWLAAGGGWPQGARAELGLHIGPWAGFAFAVSMSDVWSSHPQTGMFTMLVTINIPIRTSTVIPYIMAAHGEVFKIFGGADRYTILAAGGLIPLRKELYVRPEIGVDFCTKYLYGGSSLWGGTSPEVDEDVTRLYLNCSLEVDLLAFFR